MKLKRFLAAVVAAVMVCALLSACAGKQSKDTSDSQASGIATNDDGSIQHDLTALELSKLMGNGINLGNTMEAYGHTSLSVDSEPVLFETMWGQPETTQLMIDGMKEAGFDSIRIPVAWTNAMDYDNDDFTIQAAYLDRVEEIVNYALNDDMYVIINDHWDGSWWGMFGSASEETREKAMKMYKSMWTQICERFGKYSDRLIFESANEELGDRLNDTDVAADSGTLNVIECYEKTNEINQTFVDLVRGTGGNNAERFLLIAGYNTDIDCTCDDKFKMPTDTADHKLLLSVHYYTPWDYCGTEAVSQWGNKLNLDEQNDQLAKLTKFTDEGYGVIIGEYAVALKNGETKKDTDKFIENFLDNCDIYNYVPMLWDCSSLYKRLEHKITDETIAKLFKERSLSAQSDMSEEEIISAAKQRMEEKYKLAEEVEAAQKAQLPDENTAVAWIMYQSANYQVSYSVGDEYNPFNITEGLVANDVTVTGEGEYEVSLDMSELFAQGCAFSAVGITNGEQLFPDCIIDIQEVCINDTPIELEGDDYTCSDDGKCTRVNLFNEWARPDSSARMADGNVNTASSMIMNIDSNLPVKKLSVKFKLVGKK